MVRVCVPEPVARAAKSTPAGRSWLVELPDVLAELERCWDIRIGAALTGGTASYVATATTSNGGAAVVKVALTAGIEGHGSFEAELATLTAGGQGYVRVLAHDSSVPALLMERLGSPLGTSGLPVREQLTAVAETLTTAWAPASAGLPVPTLEEKGPWLAEFIDRTWARVGRPCRRAVIDAAVDLASGRAAAYDATTSVLLHGDAHPMNLLSAPAGGFRLIDPDGVIGEREYDLAIPIRELGATDLQPNVCRAVRELCQLMAEAVDADPEAIWQWALVERVSTGLLCAQLAHRQWAAQLLEVADDLIS